MKLLSDEEVLSRLGALPGWKIEEQFLVKTFKFKTSSPLFHFVNRVGDAAEEANHHPDIDIRYNRVRLSLTTHDAGALPGRTSIWQDEQKSWPNEGRAECPRVVAIT